MDLTQQMGVIWRLLLELTCYNLTKAISISYSLQHRLQHYSRMTKGVADMHFNLSKMFENGRKLIFNYSRMIKEGCRHAFQFV